MLASQSSARPRASCKQSSRLHPPLTVEVLEDRLTPASTNIFAVGADAGAAPTVKVYDTPTRQVLFSFNAYDPGFRGGVHVAVGDLNSDGFPDIITGAGPGAGPHVKVFDGVSGAEVKSFFAYDPAFRGGVTVAAGQFFRPGLGPIPSIVTGAGPGAGPHVKVFASFGEEIASFFAFDPSFAGGVTVATGNTTGMNTDSIIVGAGPGAGPHVKVFGPTFVPNPAGRPSFLFVPLTELRSFFAFDASFRGGVSVAAINLGDDIDSNDDLLIGAGAGAPGGHVKVFRGTDISLLRSFLAYDSSFTGGVRVGAVDLERDGFPEILTGPGGATGTSAVQPVKLFNSTTLGLVDSFFAFGTAYRGGVFVGSLGR
jgi:hypothetical protein